MVTKISREGSEPVEIDVEEAQARAEALAALKRFHDVDGSGWLVLGWSEWLRQWMRVALFWQAPDNDMMSAIKAFGMRDDMNIAVVNVWNVWDDFPTYVYEHAPWIGRDDVDGD